MYSTAQSLTVGNFPQEQTWPQKIHEKFAGKKMTVDLGIQIYDDMTELHKIYESKDCCEEVEIAVAMLLSYMNKFPLLMRLRILSRTENLQ